jgi:hypothetical protein
MTDQNLTPDVTDELDDVQGHARRRDDEQIDDTEGHFKRSDDTEDDTEGHVRHRD